MTKVINKIIKALYTGGSKVFSYRPGPGVKATISIIFIIIAVTILILLGNLGAYIVLGAVVLVYVIMIIAALWVSIYDAFEK